MRIVPTAVIFMTLLATIVSCGGESEPETADSPVTENVTDTSITEEHLITDDTEHPQEVAEIVSAAAGPEGLWDTTMGHMELAVDDSDNVTGEYPLGTVEGTLAGNSIEFTYFEGSLSGEGTFIFEDDFNSFTGIQIISGTELVWNGRRL